VIYFQIPYQFCRSAGLHLVASEWHSMRVNSEIIVSGRLSRLRTCIRTRVEALITSTQIYRLKLYGNWPARHAAPATSECYDGVPAPVARRDQWTPISERERTLGDHTGYHLPFSAIMLAENVELRFTDVYLSDFTGD